MRDRVTEKELNNIIRRINQMTGNPETPWTPKAKGHGMTANIGNYHLSGAYGGVSLHQMMNEGGGIHDVFRCGHVPKRELRDRLEAFIAGLDANK